MTKQIIITHTMTLKELLQSIRRAGHNATHQDSYNAMREKALELTQLIDEKKLKVK